MLSDSVKIDNVDTMLNIKLNDNIGVISDINSIFLTKMRLYTYINIFDLLICFKKKNKHFFIKTSWELLVSLFCILFAEFNFWCAVFYIFKVACVLCMALSQ